MRVNGAGYSRFGKDRLWRERVYKGVCGRSFCLFSRRASRDFYYLNKTLYITMSFAFWKKSKPASTPTDNAAPVQEPSRAPPAVPAKPDLSIKNMDSGAFSFEDMERLAQCSPTTPFQKLLERVKPSVASGQLDDDAAELDEEVIQSRCGTPEEPEVNDSSKMENTVAEVEKSAAIAPPTRPAPNPKKDGMKANAGVPEPERKAPLPPTKDEKIVKPSVEAPSRAAPMPPTKEESSGSFSLSAPSRTAPAPPTTEASRVDAPLSAPSRLPPTPPTTDTPQASPSLPAPSRAAPIPPAKDVSQVHPVPSAPSRSPPTPPMIDRPRVLSRSPEIPSRPAPKPHTRDLSQSQSYAIFSRPTSTVSQVESPPRRLHRPTELNLSTIKPDGSKPQSELEKQFSLMRNSVTRSKAALRSPTELLNLRLSMSSKKMVPEEKVRVFTPPQPSKTGCLLPGPAGQIAAFTSTSVRARTGAGRPAWWCKFDKLVVFDSIDADEKIHVRTSKGLSIARRRGQTETVVIPMDCAHCCEMLNRHEWTYDIQVCRRSVCWDCKERCKWERDLEIKQQTEKKEQRERERADSVLQDDEAGEEDLMRKMAIEQGRPKSPIESLEGIDERLVGIAL
jgi:hypothetical protein